MLIEGHEITGLEPLAGGSFGAVFVGKWHGSEVALKKMTDDSPLMEVQLKAEMAVARSIQKRYRTIDVRCPNVVKVYDMWRAPANSKWKSQLFMVLLRCKSKVMEFFPEGSLLDYQRRQRPEDRKPNWLPEVLHAAGMGLLQLHEIGTPLSRFTFRHPPPGHRGKEHSCPLLARPQRRAPAPVLPCGFWARGRCQRSARTTVSLSILLRY